MPPADAEIDHVDQRAFFRTVGEDAEGVARHRAVMRRALYRIDQRVMLADQALRVRQVAS